MMNKKSPPAGILLIFSQTFAPDPAAVGQHMTDAAIAMARRGYAVRVYASSRGYEDPTRRYPLRENMQGVDVRRLRLSSFGKKNLLIRIIGTASFLIQCFLIGLFTPNVKGILFSTSPPMIGFAAAWIHLLRRVPIAYWAMDLNPDQLIMMGKIKDRSFRAKLLERVNRFILNHSAAIFALDRFMADRLARRGDFAPKTHIDPPWPHEHVIEPVATQNNPFRIEHGLQGKFVFMYSGNHSPANPLDTILSAAIRFKNDPQMTFVFVGGGLGKRQIEACIQEHRLTNVLSLPYQPLESLKFSLSAADVHLVSLGENMVGIIHPCKIYGAMAAGKPILFLGPSPSHIADILHDHEIGWQIRHGDTEGAIAAIARIRNTPQAQLHQMGRNAQHLLRDQFSQETLCNRFCDRLETALQLRHG
jgi:glycosyltransferase involved in cell wall biosynthesis